MRASTGCLRQLGTMPLTTRASLSLTASLRDMQRSPRLVCFRDEPLSEIGSEVWRALWSRQVKPRTAAAPTKMRFSVGYTRKTARITPCAFRCRGKVRSGNIS